MPTAPNVHVVMSASESRIVDAWLKANKGPQEMLRLLNQIGTAGKGAGEKGSAGMNRMAQQAFKFSQAVLGIGTAFQAAHTAISFLRREFEQVESVRRQAKDTTLDVAQAEARLAFTLAPTSDISASEIVDAMAKMDTPIPIGERIRIAELAIGAGVKARTTSQRMEVGQKTIELLGKPLKDDIPALNEFARAAVSLSRRFPERSSEEILLGLTQALSNAPGGFDKAQEFAENATQAANILAAAGATFEQALGIPSGLMTSSLDPGGASVRTSITNLVDALREKTPVELRGDFTRQMEFITASGRFKDDERAIDANRRLLRSVSEEVAQMANKQSMSIKQFMRSVGIEGALDSEVQARARNRFFMEELLQPGKLGTADPFSTKNLVADAMSNILTGPEAKADFARRQKALRESDLQVPLDAQNAIESAFAKARFSPERGTRGIIVDAIKEGLPLLGTTAFRTRIESTLGTLEATAKTPTESIDVLVNVIERLILAMDRPVVFGQVGATAVSRPVIGTEQERDRVIMLDLMKALIDIRDRDTTINPPVSVPSSTPASQIFQNTPAGP